MPKLTIDDLTVEVPDGTTVLEAAQLLDIPIPHFCWHPALGKAGACRVCAVKMLDGPVKGIQMSCMLPAQDGMVVSTTDPEALAMRRHVIEWLMINHPHDCPVCDEGGECQLQDYTIAGGHGIRRYTGRKRTHLNQYLGPYIEHEMNRCIQCYRCVRFYQDFAGGTDFGVMGSAGKVYFGRFQEGQLESAFSGNLVDLCPTGVFTDKTARFRARYWDYDMAPSICQGCSLGCNTTPVARYRELLKIIARRNDLVNGWFICDKGRFSTVSAINDPNRPRTPLVEGQEVGWDAALDSLVEQIGDLERQYGPGSIAIVGSPRLSLEAATLLPALADITSAGTLCYFADDGEGERSMTAASQLSLANAASMADVQQADCIAIVDTDLVAEGPMMALAVRQAWRKGAEVFVVGAGTTVPFEFFSVTTLEEVPFSDAQRPVIICGTAQTNIAAMQQITGYGAKLAYLLPGPNAFGAALLSHRHGATSLTEAIAKGNLKGIIAIEADLPTDLLAALSFVAVLDWRATETIAQATIVFPTTSWAEMDGTCINNEGRAQRFKKVMNPGLAVKGLDPAGHPSHLHRSTAPGGDLRPAWQIVLEMIERLGGELAAEPLRGRWEQLRELQAVGEGVSVCEL